MKDVKDELKEIIDELVIEGNAIILIGDFNARIGKWKIDEEGELVESRELGKKLSLVKEIGGVAGEERDGDIKAQKNKVRVALRKWVKSRREGDKEELKRERQRLNEARKAKKEEERLKVRARLENSKLMTEFWAAIRGFRPKRKRRGENIEKEKQEGHFKSLLGGETGEEEGVDLGGEEEEEGAEGEQDEIMNREIGIQEVERILAGMKNGKAAGEDGVTMEFLKYLPRAWTQEITEILNEIFKGEGII